MSKTETRVVALDLPEAEVPLDERQQKYLGIAEEKSIKKR